MRGGVNLELLARISALEQLVQRLENRIEKAERHASMDDYGIVRLSDSQSVTATDGLALPSREKNAAINGTLANQIKGMDNRHCIETVYVEMRSGAQEISPGNPDAPKCMRYQNGLIVMTGVFVLTREINGNEVFLAIPEKFANLNGQIWVSILNVITHDTYCAIFGGSGIFVWGTSIPVGTYSFGFTYK